MLVGGTNYECVLRIYAAFFMPGIDAICRWKALRSFSTYVLNKPRGIVSQRNDVLGRDSVACPQLTGWMLSDLLHLLLQSYFVHAQQRFMRYFTSWHAKVARTPTACLDQMF